MSTALTIKRLPMFCVATALAINASETVGGTKTLKVTATVKKHDDAAVPGAELKVSGNADAAPCTGTPRASGMNQWPYTADGNGQFFFDGQPGAAHGPAFECSGDTNCAKGSCTFFLRARDPVNTSSGHSIHFDIDDCCDAAPSAIDVTLELSSVVSKPTLPQRGLIGLGVLTAIGGAIIVGRRRTRIGFGE